MQSNKSPDLLVRNSETGRWIKVSVQITQNDNDDCHFESQFKSSESCHQNGIESYSHTQIGHCDHVDEEACKGDSDHCDDNDEEDDYILSDCESDTVSLHDSHCEDNCGEKEEERWRKVWTAEKGAFQDIKSQHTNTFPGHTLQSDETLGQYTFKRESVFQGLGLKCNEDKDSIEGMFDSHLNNVLVNFLESQLIHNPPQYLSPPNPPRPPDPPRLSAPPGNAQIPVISCMNHTPGNPGSPNSRPSNIGKVGHSGNMQDTHGRGRGRGGGRGGGAGEGGRGGKGGGGDGGPPPTPQGGGQKVTLTIKTAPNMWGVTEHNHTKANCNGRWLDTFVDYFQFVENDWEENFQWLNNRGELNGATDDRTTDIFKVTQYIAMLIVWIGREDLPGSHEPHDQVDLFTYRTDGFIDSNQEGYDVGAILNGIEYENPQNRF